MKYHLIFIGLAILAVGFIGFGRPAITAENPALSHITFYVT